MNIDFNQTLSQFDTLHYSLMGISAFLFVLLLILSLRKNQSTEQKSDLSEEPPPVSQTKQQAPTFNATSPDSALQLLALLQQEARLVDFLEEDAQSFSDAEVGAAARVVHEGARRVLRENFTLKPVREEQEGVRITLEKGFNNQENRLSGNVVGEAPFSGVLIHRGWRVEAVKLPKVNPEHDLKVIVPAELEM